MRILPVLLLMSCALSLSAQDAQAPAPSASPSTESPAPTQAPAAPATTAPEQTAPPAAAPGEKKQSPREDAWEILKTGAQNTSTDRRTKAIGVLGLIPNDTRARQLAEAGLQDGEANVRSAAANALGEMQARSSIPLLKNCLNDDDTGVVLACGRALLQLKDKAGYEVYYTVLTGERKANGSLMSRQMKLLHDPKKLAQIGIEEGLGFVPFAGMGYTAYRMLSKDEVSPVRAAAARALASDPDPQSATALENAVSDKSWIVRKAALDALAKRDDPKMLKVAVEAMGDDKDIVMYTAAAVVVHLGDPRSTARKKSAPAK